VNTQHEEREMNDIATTIRHSGEPNKAIAHDLGLSESYVSQIATGALDRRYGP